MKKIIAIFAFSLYFFPLYAQDGFTYFDLAGGYMTQKHYIGEVSFDFGLRYHRAFEILGDFSYKKGGNNSYKLGFAYKPLLTRNKNTSLNLRLTSSVGTNEHNFVWAFSAGTELCFWFPNRMAFFVRQKNELVLWDKDHWRFGGLLGFKIPIN